MKAVYLDTTVASFYFEDRLDLRSQYWRQVTRRWWETRNRFACVTSDFVFEELARAPAAKRDAAIDLLAEVERLEVPPEFEQVVAHYIEHRLMPGDLRGDAAHLALASLHRVPYLLTWNLHHLANPNKRRHIRVINATLGLPTPEIVTPEELLPLEELP